MLRKQYDHGFSEQSWSAAKAEAKRILGEIARRRQMITYSDLVRSISQIALEPHDSRLFHFLGEISSEEDAAGRGMLTALVVHKAGDMEPGPGFFELAKSLGRDVTNPMECWVKEMHRVHAQWERR